MRTFGNFLLRLLGAPRITWITLMLTLRTLLLFSQPLMTFLSLLRAGLKYPFPQLRQAKMSPVIPMATLKKSWPLGAFDNRRRRHRFDLGLLLLVAPPSRNWSFDFHPRALSRIL